MKRLQTDFLILALEIVFTWILPASSCMRQILSTAIISRRAGVDLHFQDSCIPKATMEKVTLLL